MRIGSRIDDTRRSSNTILPRSLGSAPPPSWTIYLIEVVLTHFPSMTFDVARVTSRYRNVFISSSTLVSNYSIRNESRTFHGRMAHLITTKTDGVTVVPTPVGQSPSTSTSTVSLTT